ncbi:hypothetical protein YC2023_032524 [Brassica napus]
MQDPENSRIDLVELKVSKSELDKTCHRLLGKENLPLHNKLIHSILRNASLAKSPPPAGHPNQNRNDHVWSNGVVLPKKTKKTEDTKRKKKKKRNKSDQSLRTFKSKGSTNLIEAKQRSLKRETERDHWFLVEAWVPLLSLRNSKFILLFKAIRIRRSVLKPSLISICGEILKVPSFQSGF